MVITDGVNGSYIFSKQEPSFHCPAFRLEKIVDTTGCGDVYHGVFLFSLACGLTLRECATRASAAAAINAQGLGGRGMLPTMPELDDCIKSHNISSNYSF